MWALRVALETVPCQTSQQVAYLRLEHVHIALFCGVVEDRNTLAWSAICSDTSDTSLYNRS